MSISFGKIQWIAARAALVLVGALTAGTWLRAESAELDDQGTRLGLSDEEKLVTTEMLPNVPGKKITVTVVGYAPGQKSGSHHHPEASSLMYFRGRSVPKIPRPDRSKSTRPVKASLSRPEVTISSVRMRAQQSRRACSLCTSPMTARS
jgi:hypothetical protein